MRSSVVIRFGIRRAEVKVGEFGRVAAATDGRTADFFRRRAHAARLRRTVAIGAHCFREKFTGVFDFGPLSALRFSVIASPVCLPNKSPEPTPGSVTPRAIVRAVELKPVNANRDAARVVPAPGVAHL